MTYSSFSDNLLQDSYVICFQMSWQFWQSEQNMLNFGLRCSYSWKNIDKLSIAIPLHDLDTHSINRKNNMLLGVLVLSSIVSIMIKCIWSGLDDNQSDVFPWVLSHSSVITLLFINCLNSYFLITEIEGTCLLRELRSWVKSHICLWELKRRDVELPFFMESVIFFCLQVPLSFQWPSGF